MVQPRSEVWGVNCNQYHQRTSGDTEDVQDSGRTEHGKLGVPKSFKTLFFHTSDEPLVFGL